METIVLPRKKSGVVGLIARILSITVGITLFLIGVLLAITLIGLLPGIGVMMIGAVMTVAGFANQAAVKCPLCKKNGTTAYGARKYHCAKCATDYAIEWK